MEGAKIVQNESEAVKQPLMVSANEEKEPLEKKKEIDVDVEASFTKDSEKVEVKEPPKFIGLTKEELAKYEFDPFWRRLRIFLFILFWLIWLLMFAAAIAIVVMSPKCPEKPERHWWQKKVCQQIYTRSFRDSDGNGIGDLTGITEKLPLLRKIGIQTIWPTAFLKDADWSGYAPDTFREIDPDLGSEADFDDLVKTAHSQGVHVIIDLVPAVTSTDHNWFKLLTNNIKDSGSSKFNRYYVADQQKDPKFWSKVPGSEKFYYHWSDHPERPVLNMEHEDVKRELATTIKYWLDHKVNGFYILSHFLALNSAHETDFAKYGNVFQTMRDVIDKHLNDTSSRDTIMLFTSEPEGLKEDEKESLKLSWEKAGLNYIISSKFAGVNDQCDAGCLRNLLKIPLDYHERNNDSWPIWELGHPHQSRIATRVKSKERAEMLSMLLLTLPGSIINYYGDEIGLEDVAAADIDKIIDKTGSFKKSRHASRTPMQWNNGANAGFTSGASWIPVNPNYKEHNFEKSNDAAMSSVKLFKRLGGLRETDETFVYGTFSLGNNTDSNVLTIIKEGGAFKYLAALNFALGNVSSEVDLASVAGTKEADVLVMTTNLAIRGQFSVRQKVDLAKVDLQQNEGIVFKFKPAA